MYSRRMKEVEEAIAKAVQRIERGERVDTRVYDPAFLRQLAASPTLQRLVAKSETRVQKAIAEGYKSATFTGNIALAESKQHQLQRPIELTLLPLDVPNRNNQCVPMREADAILRYAPLSPVRVAWDGESIGGHAGARDVGVIESVYLDGQNIMARGILWLEHNSDLVAHLEQQDSIKSSFELYYGKSEIVNGIEYLYDTIFASQCIVSNPAYTNTSVTLK